MNGIIINDELHELISLKTCNPCDNCSMIEHCNLDSLCTAITRIYNPDERFVNRGNAKEFIEKINKD